MRAARRSWRCRAPQFPMGKSMPVCVYETKVGENDIKGLVQWVQDRLFNDPDYLANRALIEGIVDQIKPGEKVNWDKVNETITRILRVWCSEVDRLGGDSQKNEFEDTVTPICHVRS